jgi:hypothetical protein
LKAAPNGAQVKIAMSAPRLLLISTLPWAFPARLASALRGAGFEVEAACRPHNPLGDLREPVPTYSLDILDEIGSVLRAISGSRPDLLIPCDDPAVGILHNLYLNDRHGRLGKLIMDSLGDPSNFAAVGRRGDVVALASAMQLRVPRSERLTDGVQLSTIADRIGYPCVLKRDKTWKGIGVALVENRSALPAGWGSVMGWSSRFHAAKAAIRDKRPGTLLNLWRTDVACVQVQEFVPGIPANCSVLCRNGTVLAGTSVVCVKTAYSGGPASVVRFWEHPEMAATTAALVNRLGLSGFCGFDFVICPSGNAYFLELNPRPTAISHLVLGNGTHLPAALYESMTGQRSKVLQPAVSRDLIALFPTEWQRDPGGSILKIAHHDAPWDEPRLLRRFGMRASGAHCT